MNSISLFTKPITVPKIVTQLGASTSSNKSQLPVAGRTFSGGNSMKTQVASKTFMSATSRGDHFRTYSMSKEDGNSEPFINKNNKINIAPNNTSEQPNQYFQAQQKLEKPKGYSYPGPKISRAGGSLVVMNATKPGSAGEIVPESTEAIS